MSQCGCRRGTNHRARPRLHHPPDEQRKRLLDIDHLAGARLHEPEIMQPAPLQPIPRRNLPHVLQIALIPRDDAHRQDLVLLHPVFSFDVDHLREVVERFE